MNDVFLLDYSKDVKGYKLLQPNSIEIIIRKDVQFDENILSCKHDLACVPSLACNPDLTYVSSSYYSLDSTPSLVISLDEDSDDENPPPLTLVPPLAP